MGTKVRRYEGTKVRKFEGQRAASVVRAALGDDDARNAGEVGVHVDRPEAGGLNDVEAEAINRVRDKTPADPLRFE